MFHIQNGENVKQFQGGPPDEFCLLLSFARYWLRLPDDSLIVKYLAFYLSVIVFLSITFMAVSWLVSALKLSVPQCFYL